MSKPKHHQALVVKIKEILPHTNADTLEIIHVGEYQAVVKKGSFKIGDYGVYIFPDSVVPQTEPFRFIWGSYLTEPDGTCPEKRRRITVRKFRGEWSEGLLMPYDEIMASLHPTETVKYFALARANDGYDISETLGITHYNPPEPVDTGGLVERGPISRPKGLKGFFYRVLNTLGLKIRSITESAPAGLPVYDVESFKNNVGVFTEDDEVIVTEKIHGSNARFVFKNSRMYAGSRNLWKSPKSNCVWRKALAQNPWIEKWCRKNEGYVLYGEVVPTQGKFTYGCENDQIKVFLFDILSPEGEWLDWNNVTYQCSLSIDLMLNWVPVLYIGNFHWQSIEAQIAGKSYIPFGDKNAHIREGIVIRSFGETYVTGLGRKQLKVISNDFLLKDNQ